MEFVGAQTVCMHYNQRSASTSTRQATSSPSNDMPTCHQIAVSQQGIKRKGGGGSQRAFISKRTRGMKGKVNFHEINAEYKLAKAMQTEEYKQAEVMGKAGSTRHNLDGASSFDPNPRAVNRKAMQKVTPFMDDNGKLVLPVQSLLQVQSEPGQPLASMLKNTLEEELRSVRKQTLARSKTRLALLQEGRKSLHDFLAMHTEPTLATLLNHCLALGQFSSSLHLVPSQNYVLHEVAFDTRKKATNLVAWASGHSRATFKLFWTVIGKPSHQPSWTHLQITRLGLPPRAFVFAALWANWCSNAETLITSI
eukprot:948706-Amphidinium_carterae.2